MAGEVIRLSDMVLLRRVHFKVLDRVSCDWLD
jgi:hypothetical protein